VGAGNSAPDTCGHRGGLVEGDSLAGTDTCGRRDGLVKKGDSLAETDTCGRHGDLVEGDSPAETDTCLACASYHAENTARDSPAEGWGRVQNILDNNTAAETHGEEGSYCGALVVCRMRAAGDNFR
jgi:hypothetical protein